MFDIDEDEAFTVQLEVLNTFRTLLFNPSGSHQDMERQAKKLFEIYGNSEGTFTYFDLERQAIRGIRSKNVQEILLEKHDPNAPFEGILFVKDLLSGLALR